MSNRSKQFYELGRSWAREKDVKELFELLVTAAVPWDGQWTITHWENVEATRGGIESRPGEGAEITTSLAEHAQAREEIAVQVAAKGATTTIAHGTSRWRGSFDDEATSRTGFLLDDDHDSDGHGWSLIREILDAAGISYIAQRRPAAGKYHIEIPFATPEPLSPGDKPQWSAQLGWVLGVLAEIIYPNDAAHGFDPLTDRLLQLVHLYVRRKASEPLPETQVGLGTKAVNWIQLLVNFEFPTENFKEEIKKEEDHVPTNVTPELLERSSAYLATLPESIESQGGQEALWRAALALVKGFGLSVDDAYKMLIEEYNPRCRPPWSEKELQHKVDDAAKAQAPSGYLLEGPTERMLRRVLNPKPIKPPFYTDEEITQFAKSQNCTLGQFRYRWIILQGTAFYLFHEGKYLSPLLRTELTPAMRKRDLARIPNEKSSLAGIDWVNIKEDGSVKLKSVEDILRNYATVARKTVASLIEPYSRYNPKNQTFYEAVCPLQPITPCFHEEIDKWLRLLGGKDAEKLLDWVATVTKLERVSCAIYIQGPKDFGKSMFAEGLAQLWGHSATELQTLNSSFNSALINNPLVFADEEIPKNISSGFLRSLVGSSSRALRRKFMPEAELLGAIRLIIAANTPDLLQFNNEDFSKDDIDAIAAKILYIQPSEKTGDYLRALGGRQGTQGWVEGGYKIAAHALWLRDHRSVELGSRFLVEGIIDTIHRKLSTNGSIRGSIIEWIGKAMMKKSVIKEPGIVFGEGKLYVNASYIKSTWEEHVGEVRVPSLTKIGMALKPLAQGEKRLTLKGKRADFYDLKTLPILEALKELQIGTLDDFQLLINSSVEYQKNNLLPN